MNRSLLAIFVFCTMVLGMSASFAAPNDVSRNRYSLPLADTSKWWARHELSLGVQMGPAFYDADSNVDDKRAGIDVGPSIGVSGEAKLWQFIYLQREVNYVNKGMSFDGGGYSIHYLENPALIKLKPSQTYYSLRPYVMAGPNLAFKLGASKNGQGFSSSLEPIDFSFELGAGVERDMGRRITAFTHLRGSMGLIDVSKNSDTTWSNFGFQILVGAKYRI